MLSSRQTGRGLRQAWETPAVSTVPIRATAAARHWYVDGPSDGMVIFVVAPVDAPTNSAGADDHPVQRDRCNATGHWQAPAVTTMSIRAASGK